jgi:hypothetical protein
MQFPFFPWPPPISQPYPQILPFLAQIIRAGKAESCSTVGPTRHLVALYKRFCNKKGTIYRWGSAVSPGRKMLIDSLTAEYKDQHAKIN